MSRKHFVEFANILREHRAELMYARKSGNREQYELAIENAFRLHFKKIAQSCSASDNKFDYEKFIDAIYPPNPSTFSYAIENTEKRIHSIA